MKLQAGRAAGVSLGLFLVLSVAHYRNLTDWDSQSAASSAVIALGLGVLLLPVLLVRNPLRGLLAPTLTDCCIILFFLWTCIAAILFGHQTAHALLSAVAALILAAFFMTFRQEIRAGQTLHIAGIILAGFTGILFAVLPVRWGFTLGGIQPNQFAKLGLAVLVLGHCTAGRFRLLALGIAILCALISTSRAAILFLTVFATVYYLPENPMRRAITLTLGGAAVLGLFFADWLLSTGVFAHIRDKLLLLSDPALGLGSGFSGRDKYWQSGLQAIPENILGWGYNTRGATGGQEAHDLNAHQGYINLVLDAGVIGLFLFLAALASFFVHVRKSAAQGNTVSRAGAAFCMSYPFIMALDPIYFSITLPLSAIFLGFLCSGYGRPARFRRPAGVNPQSH